MLVGEKDSVCQFCGAEFVMEIDEAKSEGHALTGRLEHDSEAEPEVSEIGRMYRELLRKDGDWHARTIDVVGLFDRGRLSFDASEPSGASSPAYNNSVRLLRKTEALLRSAEEFGIDIEESRKHLLSAWKACDDGNCDKAIQLSEKCKRRLAIGVIHVVRGQISCFREAMLELKRRGSPISPLVIEMKTIQKALDELRIDEAIDLTRLLISNIKDAQMTILRDFGGEPDEADPAPCYLGSGI